MSLTAQNIQGASEVKKWLCKDFHHSYQLSPDTIDDFITWLYERVDLDSFRRSSADYKGELFARFCVQQINAEPQLKMAL